MSLLEPERRLSESALWALQRLYYTRQGIDAWRQGTVPHYITSNPFIARAYAQVILGYWRDWQAAGLDPSQPLYVVELGAGSGRFTYYCLKALAGLLSRSRLGHLRLCYVATDFAAANLEFWRAHPRLQPYLRAGQLDFALLDATRPGALALTQSGLTLSPQTLANPLVVIANYLFDSLPQDCFTVEAGRLYEQVVSLTSPQPAPDLNDPALLDGLALSYRRRLAPQPYYPDADLDAFLTSYSRRLADATFTLPVAALRAVRHFQHLSRDRLLVLTADKAYHHEFDVKDRDLPGMQVHGSFSMMVNGHALAAYAVARGGEALTLAHDHGSLDVMALLFGQPPGGYAEARLAYALEVEQGGPDDFFSLGEGLRQQFIALSLRQLLAFLRLSGWDPHLFLACYPDLRAKLGSVSVYLREEVRAATRHLWDNYYHLGERRDLAFSLGLVLQKLEFYADALAFYEHSLALCGPDASTLYNQGMCYYHLGQLEAALHCLDQALARLPDYEAALAAREKIQAALAQRAFSPGAAN